MTDDSLAQLRAQMDEIKDDVDEACWNRAWKLACEGKLKHPECVDVYTTDGPDPLGVTLLSSNPNGNKWTINFFPGGTLSLELDWEGSSDSRATRMLKSIGEVHRR